MDIRWQELIGQRVTVHKNLNRGCWSVTHRGKVIHVNECYLADVSFRIRENARQQVIAKHCRAVHAWCVGTLVDGAPSAERIPITYNPYRSGAFTRRDGAGISHAAFIHFTPSEEAVAVGAVASAREHFRKEATQ